LYNLEKYLIVELPFCCLLKLCEANLKYILIKQGKTSPDLLKYTFDKILIGIT